MSGAWLSTSRQRSVGHNKSLVDGMKHEYLPTQSLQNTRSWARSWSWIDIAVKALALILLFANVVLLSQRHRQQMQELPTDLEGPGFLETPIISSRFLYLAVPSSADDNVDLCKTLLTAQILNYPVPELIRWGRYQTGQPVEDEARAQAKLLSIQDWLSHLPKEADDGLVILLSGPDTWFQLRPEVLLQRYYDILEAQSGGLDAIASRVIFAAEPNCLTPADLAWRSPRACQESQGAFLSESMIIGPVSEVRAMINEAVDMTLQDDLNDTLAVFDAIFARQEGKGAATKEKEFRIALDTKYDLGILADVGLDARLRENLRRDIYESMSPFWTPSGQEPEVPHGLTWEDVRLFGQEEGVSRGPPAMLHFHTNGSTQPSEFKADTTVGIHAAPKEDLWPYLWLQPYARALYTAAVLTPTVVIAVVKDDQGRLLKFWGEERLIEKAGINDRLHGRLQRWNETCWGKEASQAIFLDLKGDWEAPIHL